MGWRRSVALKTRVQFFACQTRSHALILHIILSRVPALVLVLVIEQCDQEVDVLHGQAEDFVLAEFLVGWVRGNEFPQLRESPVDVLLSPAFTAVGEDAAGEFLGRAFIHLHLKVRGGSPLDAVVADDTIASS